jgi:hypothetical protein
MFDHTLQAARDEFEHEVQSEVEERSLLERRLALAEERVNNLEVIVSGRIASALGTASRTTTEAMRRLDKRAEDVGLALRDIKPGRAPSRGRWAGAVSDLGLSRRRRRGPGTMR